MQAESVNELVGARTAAAADSALAGLTGGIGARVQWLRHSALTLLAQLEVHLLNYIQCVALPYWRRMWDAEPCRCRSDVPRPSPTGNVV